MFTLLSLLPRWLVFAVFWYVAGFAYGQWTVYRKIAIEERTRQAEVTARSAASSVRPVTSAPHARPRVR